MCGGAEYEQTSLEAETSNPDGLICGGCGERWRPLRARDAKVCPACRSENIGEIYPEIPSLDHDPGLALVLTVESCIPRTEGGVILYREMAAWLRGHGVRDRAEVLTWEWFFREIASIRSRIIEELMPTPKADGEEERED